MGHMLCTFFVLYTFYHMNLEFFLFFQIPLAIVSLGPEPRTQIDKASNVFSGHVSLFFPELFRNIPKESYPVLPAWDGSGHYAQPKFCL